MGKSVPTNSDSPITDAKKSKTKKSKQSAEDPTEEVDDSPGKPENKKQKKLNLKAGRKTEISQEVPVQAATMDSKKDKKRKRKQNEEGDSTTKHDDVAQEPPKKKHKNRTDFADPREDTSLNNQSRKALEYAFTQMNKPKKWKFNKARQNWIIRNVWVPDSLPDAYFPLAVRYLSGMQGGSREKLKESCQSHLKAQEDPPISESTINPTNSSNIEIASEPQVKSSLKAKPIPGPLIGAIPTPGLLTSPSTTVVVAASSDVAAALAEVRRSRAQILLDQLSP